MAGRVTAKRWNDPAEPQDGTRILITRYRPRGVSKSAETWDTWVPNLGPSRELLALFKGKTGEGIPWPIYRSRYLTEMRQRKDLVIDLARRVAGGESVCLLCSSSCVREDRCHRSLLKQLVEEEAARLA
jgi:uncharacterized protein YeaO (DUF488 family)